MTLPPSAAAIVLCLPPNEPESPVWYHQRRTVADDSMGTLKPTQSVGKRAKLTRFTQRGGCRMTRPDGICLCDRQAFSCWPLVFRGVLFSTTNHKHTQNTLTSMLRCLPPSHHKFANALTLAIALHKRASRQTPNHTCVLMVLYHPKTT